MRYKNIHNPFKIVRMFEEELAHYCGSQYAVAVDSCTNAIFLSCLFYEVKEVSIPRNTYLSVPQSIINAGGTVNLINEDWRGQYQLKPYPIIDSALRFTSKMYTSGTLTCLSFHYKKHLPIGKGGAILTDDYDAYSWLKKKRYEGRDEVNYWEDKIDSIGWNMYMTPSEAAVGLSLMQNIRMHNDDIIEDGGYRPLDDFLTYL